MEGLDGGDVPEAREVLCRHYRFVLWLGLRVGVVNGAVVILFFVFVDEIYFGALPQVLFLVGSSPRLVWVHRDAFPGVGEEGLTRLR